MSSRSDILQLRDDLWIVPVDHSEGMYTRIYRNADGEYVFYAQRQMKVMTSDFKRAVELARASGVSMGTKEDIQAEEEAGSDNSAVRRKDRIKVVTARKKR